MAKIVRSAKNADNVPIVVTLPVDVNQTIAYGDLVEINTGSRKLQAASVSSTTLVGIAQAPLTTGGSSLPTDNIPVALIRREVVRINVDQSGAKTTFVQTDFYTTSYNLKSKTAVDPNNTTSGMMNVQAFDSVALTADVMFTDASLANIG